MGADGQWEAEKEEDLRTGRGEFKGSRWTG